MNLLNRLLAKLKPNKPRDPNAYLLSPAQEAELKAAIHPPEPLPKPKRREGRVIKQTRHSEFSPHTMRHGGRVVKVMPKQLQKIKQAQEKFEDEQVPRIED